MDAKQQKSLRNTAATRRGFTLIEVMVVVVVLGMMAAFVAPNVFQQVGHAKEELSVITGNVPNPLEFPTGCKFWPRCPHAIDRCKVEEPELETINEAHTAACWRVNEIEDAHPLLEGNQE